MKFASILAAMLLFTASIFIACQDRAEAARLGGGRSFGSKPFMSQPAQRPAMRQQTPGQARQNQALPQQGARPGLLGGMGGLFGGLLAGTLLGSLLGGHGFAGGGGFMDIIIFGILAFVAYKLFMRFRNRPAQEPAQAPAGVMGHFNDRFQPNPVQRNSVESGWDALKGSPSGSVPPGSGASPDLPADFDAEDFLRGAKMAYNRLQAAWDARDMKDIANFATPELLRQLQQQLDEDPNPGKTEILLVNAQLLNVEKDPQHERAQVYFDVLMRESQDQQTPESIREIWHFVRSASGDGHWKLDGIQQVD